MGEVIKKYFVVDEVLSKTILSDWRETRSGVESSKAQVLKKFGAVGLLMRGERATALLYSDPLGDDDKRGFKEGRNRFDGEEYYIYEPDLRFKKGKTLKEYLADYNAEVKKAPGFSDYVVRRFSVHADVIGGDSASPSGMSFYRSVAGYYKEKIVLVIPFGGHEDFKLPDLPAELSEIKKSEYVALVEE